MAGNREGALKAAATAKRRYSPARGYTRSAASPEGARSARRAASGASGGSGSGIPRALPRRQGSQDSHWATRVMGRYLASFA